MSIEEVGSRIYKEVGELSKQIGGATEAGARAGSVGGQINLTAAAGAVAQSLVPSDETKQEIKKNDMLDTQALLMYNLDKISRFVQTRGTDFYNFYSITGNPNEVIARLNNVESAKILFSMTPLQISSLLPVIRISKVEYDENGNFQNEIELPLKSHTEHKSLEDIFESKRSRGDDVGLENFSYKFKGAYYAVLGRAVETQMKLVFQDINNLFKDEEYYDSLDESTGVGKAWFSDLFVRSPKKIRCAKDSSVQIPNTNYFHMKVTLGWDFVDSEIFSDELKEAIRNSVITIYLDLINHEISFNQDGSVDVLMEHIGSLDGILDNPLTNIFLLRGDAENLFQLFSLEEAGDDFVGKVFKDFVYNQRIKEFYAQLITENAPRIYELKIPKASYEKYIEKRSEIRQKIKDFGKIKSDKIEKYRNEIVELENQIINAANENSKTTRVFGEEISTSLNDSSERIYFIRFGDFLDLALQNFNEKSESIASLKTHNIQFLTGDFACQIGDKKVTTNLADIPISLHSLQYWMNNQIIDKNRHFIPFSELLNSFINECLVKVLNNEVIKSSGVQVGTEVLMLPLNSSGESLLEINSSVIRQASYGNKPNKATFSLNTNPFPESSQDARRKLRFDINDALSYKQAGFKYSMYNKKLNEIVFIVFIYSAFNDIENMRANYELDMARGMYHFFIGRDRGLMQEVVFNKDTQNYLREARAQVDGDYLFSQMREKYQCTITMFGNNLFKPGMYIYINPSFFTGGTRSDINSKLERSGFGGYYLVTNVEGGFDNTDHSLEIGGIWQSFGVDAPLSTKVCKGKRKQ